MSTAGKIGIGLFVLASVFALSIVMMVIGINNTLVDKESSVTYQYKENQNVYSNMWKTFKETAQVTTMMTEDTEKVFKAAIEGRYGEDGSKAVVQMIKEDNPKLDGSLYRQLQSAVQSGRATFSENQKLLLDKKRSYENYLKRFPNSIIAGALGFPKVDLSKFDIVTDMRTEGAFDSKKDNEEVKLR